jgi:GNAT superfamily N-acetyltransferase
MVGRVNVRKARRGDGEAAADVWLRVGTYYTDLEPGYFQVPDAAGLAARFDSAIGQAGDHALELVVEVDGRVTGFLSARLEGPEEHVAAQLVREHSWIRLAVDALIVDPSVWRRGAGRALLGAAEAWGRDRGAEVVRLDTWAESPVSVPCCELGMGYNRRSIVYEKRLR